MTLSPLLHAPLIIQIHALAALTLIPVTLAQFVRRKGGTWHRWLGWCEARSIGLRWRCSANLVNGSDISSIRAADHPCC